jgi:hypothetical protein
MLLAVGCGGNTGPSSTAPTVSSIDPNHGPAGGGTSIHIVGNHFAGAPATEVIVESATSITAKTTAHQTGASDVTVAVGGRNGTLPGAFNYDTDTAPVITSVTAQGTRPNEPKNFADLDEEVAVKAVVEDPDTPADRLTFEFASRPCSYLPRDGDACASVPSTWDSVCAPGVTCDPGRSQGIDYVTAVYEGTEWKLCASYFQGVGRVQRGFIK